jgi:hypothetical protein
MKDLRLLQLLFVRRDAASLGEIFVFRVAKKVADSCDIGKLTPIYKASHLTLQQHSVTTERIAYLTWLLHLSIVGFKPSRMYT